MVSGDKVILAWQHSTILKMALPHNNETSPDGTPTDHQGTYVLQVFKYIGDQRLKTFNYYALILAVTTAGTFTAVERFSHEVLLLCGITHVVAATVFWLIDRRNCQLTRVARAALRDYEKDSNFPKNLRVMNKDEYGDDGKPNTRDEKPWWRWPPQATFTIAFRVAYVSQILLGVGLVTWALAGAPKIRLPSMAHTTADSTDASAEIMMHGGEH